MKTYGSLSIEGGMWVIVATPDVQIRLKRIFARAEQRRTAGIYLSPTPEIAMELEWIKERWPLKVEDEDAQALADAAAGYRQNQEQIVQILGGTHTNQGLMEPARPARDYQLVAANLALATKSLLIGDDLGLGKSMEAVLVLRDTSLLPALIVCPTHLPRQWRDEIGKTLPLLTTHIIKSTTPYDVARTREMKGYQADVLITNYHKIAGWADHLAGTIRTVIFDEAQELRRDVSAKYKAAAQIADAAEVRVGLTATPVYNYAGEIYNIMNVLAPDSLGTREEFAREWGHGRWEDKLRLHNPRALGLHLREQGLFLRRTRKEVGRELPEVVRVSHNVDADEHVYDQMMSGAVDLAEIILSNKPKEAFTASGELDWKMRRATGVAKAPYVAEFVKMLLESEERIVLFAWHRDCYEIFRKKLGYQRPVLYTGTESPTQKDISAKRFLMDPEDPKGARVLMMSLRSGLGLDGLQEASSVCVFAELDWSPGIHAQCVGRLHRDGQHKSVISYFLVSDKGSDPIMADVLNIKRSQSEPLRNPDQELFDKPVDTRDRIKQLAESIVRERAQPKVPEPELAEPIFEVFKPVLTG